ncbi:MAG: type I-U CRISPR-associated protein Cas7, partial [Microthrixaceae bacterium]|nr:type I-U CRISPR-associated protein Cas7 [Microthrixaceae bacterium]
DSPPQSPKKGTNMDIDLEKLVAELGDDGRDAGLSVVADLEPLGGPGATVKPAVYAGGLYQQDVRWPEGNNGVVPDAPVKVLVVDNVPSEANRQETALRQLQGRLGLPVLVLDLGAAGELPPHLPPQLTSFDWPHRHADAYLRDSVLRSTGEPFDRSEIGLALMAATQTRPNALLEWMPQSLVYGFWQSHKGKKRTQAKFARAVEVEILGWQPATVETKQLGLKGDPLNLSVESALGYDPNDLDGWEVLDTKRGGSKKAQESLAEIGHGQVPVSENDAAPAGVSFRRIEQRGTISFARLRNIVAETPEQSAAARTLLACLGLVGIEAAFGSGFTLRSGADLVPASRSWSWRGTGTTDAVDALNLDGALRLWDEAVAHAESVGLPVGSKWASAPLMLDPNPQLTQVIRESYAVEES